MPRARVRLTREAEKDLLRLAKKDPQIVREVLKKMLLLQYSPDAGEPLLGTLVGFRKLTVGNRAYRISWRKTVDESFQPILEIAEVWAIRTRSNSEIYKELMRRVESLGKSDSPDIRTLQSVMDRLSSSIGESKVLPEPEQIVKLPQWLIEALQVNLNLSLPEIARLTQDEAQQLLAKHWS
ncbi:type II toxin-antitoxin system RelE family toxin [Corynebacterium crudilactis]|uniref:type II toxin-antitoxin system RelE family toxin n=1 Tax=Corynebacterium crudilactis TaxID=1652495 RepID=UPI0012FD2552|nr:type II toxin-antitoxin system RelE/ParE family toxin [Corynebacterium crudilactis]